MVAFLSRSDRTIPLLAFVVVVGTLLFYAALPKLWINAFAGDALFELDAAWRQASGQQPYRDVVTPLGPLFYALLRFAVWMTNGKPIFFPYINALPVLVLIPAFARMYARRFPSWLAGAMTIFWGIRTLSPRFLDDGAFAYSFLAPYNPLGLWLLMPFVLCLITPRPVSVKIHCEETMVLGICLAGLIGLKGNEAMVAVLALLGLMWRNPRPLYIQACWVVPSALIIAAWLLMNPSGLWAYGFDVSKIAQANPWGQRILSKAVEAVLSEPEYLAYTVWFLVVWRPRAWGDVSHWAKGVGLLIPWAVMLNDHETTPILLAVCTAVSFQEARSYRMLAGLPLLVVCGWHGLQDGVGLGRYAGIVQNSPSTTLVGKAPGLSLLEWGGLEPEIDGLNEGTRLLQTLPDPHPKVFTVMTANIFPYVLNIPPPKGGMAWWDRDRTYSLTSHLSPQQVFADVTVVMVPTVQWKQHTPTDQTLFWKIYGSYIQHHYRACAHTPRWTLYGQSFKDCPPPLVGSTASPISQH